MPIFIVCMRCCFLCGPVCKEGKFIDHNPPWCGHSMKKMSIHNAVVKPVNISWDIGTESPEAWNYFQITQHAIFSTADC